MDVLRTGVSILGMFDPEEGDNSHDANVRKAIRIISKMPTLVAYGSRLPQGLEPVEPRGDLSLSENFLYMLHGVVQDQPGPHIFDKTLIVYAEHEFNASSFSARVTSSTLSDMHSAVTSAVGTLKGPLHGGANADVMRLLLAIGRDAGPDRAEAFVREKLGRKEKIPGFGHRVYRTEDPRATHLRRFSKLLGEKAGEPQWYAMSERIEQLVKTEKKLYPNVDFYSASTFHSLGIPVDLFTPIFAVSRISGWSAHVLEQYANNRLIRPRTDYIGPKYPQRVTTGDDG
jgi:citrate synthase